MGHLPIHERLSLVQHSGLRFLSRSDGNFVLSRTGEIIVCERMMSKPQSAVYDAELRKELATGERVVWSARPDPKRMRVVFWIWAFALPWTLFALVWEASTVAMMVAGVVKNDPNVSWLMLIFPIFGLPFIGVGLWMMNKPFVALADARQTIHALTNRRLMSLTLRNGKSLKSVELTKLGPIVRKEKADGWGYLSVETGSHIDSDGDRITDRFELGGIPNVAELERLLRQAQQAR
jgi:hypothetical protein